MTFKDAITNLDKMSNVLEKVANKPENYNTEWANYLEQMSWSLHKYANELRDIESLVYVTHKNNVI